MLPHCPWYFSFFTIFQWTNSSLIHLGYTPLWYGVPFTKPPPPPPMSPWPAGGPLLVCAMSENTPSSSKRSFSSALLSPISSSSSQLPKPRPTFLLMWILSSMPLPTNMSKLPWLPGPRFNIKMSSYQYRKSHCGHNTVVRSSYLHNGLSYTGKMTSLYWIGVLLYYPDFLVEMEMHRRVIKALHSEVIQLKSHLSELEERENSRTGAYCHRAKWPRTVFQRKQSQGVLYYSRAFQRGYDADGFRPCKNHWCGVDSCWYRSVPQGGKDRPWIKAPSSDCQVHLILAA